MAKDPDAEQVLAHKTVLMERLLELTKEALLLVDLADLEPVLAKKDALIADVRRLDEQLAALTAQPAPDATALKALTAAVLENELRLEQRIVREQEALRAELREFDRQTRMRTYLEQGRRKGQRVNLTR